MELALRYELLTLFTLFTLLTLLTLLTWRGEALGDMVAEGA